MKYANLSAPHVVESPNISEYFRGLGFPLGSTTGVRTDSTTERVIEDCFFLYSTINDCTSSYLSWLIRPRAYNVGNKIEYNQKKRSGDM
jgi:hypothetical protein